MPDVQSNREERFQTHSTGNRIHNSSADFPNMLLLPNNLVDFVNNGTTEEATSVGGNAYCFHGDLYYSRDAYFCECCSCRMEIHNTYHFHIIKNFNEKVVSEIRKDEQRRLLESGDKQGAKALKGSKYILTSKRSTLQKKDKEASEGKVIQKGNALFGVPEIKQIGGNEARYDELLKQNKLLFTVDLVREMLTRAFQRDTDTDMANDLDEIIPFFQCFFPH